MLPAIVYSAGPLWFKEGLGASGCPPVAKASTDQPVTLFCATSRHVMYVKRATYPTTVGVRKAWGSPHGRGVC